MPIAKFISLRHLEWSPSEWVTSFFSHTNRSTLCAFQFRLKLYACRLNEVQDWLLCRQACWVFVFIRLSSDLSRQSVNSVCMHAISQLETLVSEEMKLRMRRILDEPMHRISVNIWSLSPTHRNDGGRERERDWAHTHIFRHDHIIDTFKSVYSTWNANVLHRHWHTYAESVDVTNFYFFKWFFRVHTHS